MELREVYHLFRRAGFGIMPDEAQYWSEFSREEVIDALFDSASSYEPLEIEMAPFTDFLEQNPDARFPEFRKVVQANGEFLIDLNKAWVERLCVTKDAFVERMTLFWANVFVVDDNVPIYVQKYNNTLRKYALGNFRDFVKAISKEAAMIKYLNGNQNRKGHPNENFARELMELFTLGVGNYTEQDIKEVARAFTGYAHRPDGSFLFLRRRHDYEEKEFFGFKGRMDGDAVIEIITRKRECALFICRKVYAYFVNENVDEARVEEMADVFHGSLDIATLMRFVFGSNWFYDEANIGTKIKSPMDLLTSIHLMVPFQFTGEKQHIFLQRLLGQQLSKPPNVAGWEGGRSWIDANTILVRLKLASILLGDGEIPFQDNYKAGQNRPFGNRLKMSRQWNIFDEIYGDLSPMELIVATLATSDMERIQDLLQEGAAKSMKEYCLQLMSLPEFQLT